MVRNNYYHMNKLFYTGFLDTRVLATLHAVNHNCIPKNFKLMTLLNHFGIPFVEKELHGALYDIQKTRELFMEVEKML